MCVVVAVAVVVAVVGVARPCSAISAAARRPRLAKRNTAAVRSPRGLARFGRAVCPVVVVVVRWMVGGDVIACVPLLSGHPACVCVCEREPLAVCVACASVMCQVSAATKMCNHVRRTLSYLTLFSSISMSSRFYRFLARFSGRRRSAGLSLCAGRMPSLFPATLLVLSSLLAATEACSSRSTPKPRPPSPTPRPNITFHTYACPPAYATFYCLNGATCFTVKIGESLLYNCECADGYMGQRCEFKDLDGSYLPSRQRVMLETASIASGATIAVFLVVIVCAFLYIRHQRRQKQNRATSCVDGSVDVERRPQPFARRSHHHVYPLSRVTTEGNGDAQPTLLVTERPP